MLVVDRLGASRRGVRGGGISDGLSEDARAVLEARAIDADGAVEDWVEAKQSDERRGGALARRRLSVAAADCQPPVMTAR